MYVYANLDGKNVGRQYLAGSLSGALSLAQSKKFGWAKPRRPRNVISIQNKKNLGGTAIAVGIQLYAGTSVAKSLEK